jgi:hypothetical protein
MKAGGNVRVTRLESERGAAVDYIDAASFGVMAAWMPWMFVLAFLSRAEEFIAEL